MKSRVTLEKSQIESMIRGWAEKRGWTLLGFDIKVDLGDPQDPREAGYRRESIGVDVEVPDDG